MTVTPLMDFQISKKMTSQQLVISQGHAPQTEALLNSRIDHQDWAELLQSVWLLTTFDVD
jgi:hypothetical protein